MYFGCNETQYATIKPSVPGMTMARSYWTSIPTKGWPVMQDGLACCLDLKPADWQGMASGKYNSQIHDQALTAPPGTMLTAYHECDKYAYAGNQPFGPATMCQIHEQMLTATAGTPVTYGSCLTQGQPHIASPKPLSPWVISGLGFAGGDFYSDPISRFPANQSLELFAAQMPAGVPLAILECNTSQPQGETYKRPSWFWELYFLLEQSGGMALLTFWNPAPGPDSGPFLPADQYTVYAMAQIAQRAAAGQA